MSVVIIGGTGNLGFGIGYRLAMAGETVVIGSRQKEKADEAAVRMNAVSYTHLDGYKRQRFYFGKSLPETG